MNITEATNEACKEDSLVEALTYIAIWENERVVDYVTTHDGIFETCFGVCFSSVLDAWKKKEERNASETDSVK